MFAFGIVQNKFITYEGRVISVIGWNNLTRLKNQNVLVYVLRPSKRREALFTLKCYSGKHSEIRVHYSTTVIIKGTSNAAMFISFPSINGRVRATRS